MQDICISQWLRCDLQIILHYENEQLFQGKVEQLDLGSEALLE